jgi:hypothetical protein
MFGAFHLGIVGLPFVPSHAEAAPIVRHKISDG